MKHNIVLIALISLSLSVSAGGFKVKVSNAGQFDQSHLPVILKLDNYSKIHPTQRERLAVFVNGRQISSQLDDLNGDRIPDELVFQLNLFCKMDKNLLNQHYKQTFYLYEFQHCLKYFYLFYKQFENRY